jgi:hypothetical protein
MPGGLRTIARMPLGAGRQLSIRVKRYGFEGRIYSELIEWVQEPDGSSGGGGGVRAEGHAPLVWSLAGDCARRGTDATVVLYGLLRQAADTVYALTQGHLQRLLSARVPAYLEPGARAVYTVLPALPERITVKTPRGSVAMSEGLGPQKPTRCSSQSQISYLWSKAR